VLVFRITRAEYATALVASGAANRWNSKGLGVIYTANSRALACLENLAHLNGAPPAIPFRIMLIEIPDEIAKQRVDNQVFSAGWPVPTDIDLCRTQGDLWLRASTSAVLQVPSVLVPNEYNFLLNPRHPDFARIKLIGTEDFRFDPRLKS
jgi:RES domain-containing protein